jgi:hypothetical protein
VPGPEVMENLRPEGTAHADLAPPRMKRPFGTRFIIPNQTRHSVPGSDEPSLWDVEFAAVTPQNAFARSYNLALASMTERQTRHHADMIRQARPVACMFWNDFRN